MSNILQFQTEKKKTTTVTPVWDRRTNMKEAKLTKYFFPRFEKSDLGEYFFFFLHLSFSPFNQTCRQTGKQSDIIPRARLQTDMVEGKSQIYHANEAGATRAYRRTGVNIDK